MIRSATHLLRQIRVQYFGARYASQSSSIRFALNQTAKYSSCQCKQMNLQPIVIQRAFLSNEPPVYVEEDYLEEEEEDFDESLDSKHPDPNRPSSYLIQPEEVVSVLEAERAKNIEVVECKNPNSPYQFLVIASPYNERHEQALIETVRRYFCKKYYFGKTNPRKNVEANGWYALDFRNNVILHIMKEHLRQKYNLAKVWSEEEMENAEEEIDPDMFPAPREDDLQVASHRRAVPIIKANY